MFWKNDDAAEHSITLAKGSIVFRLTLIYTFFIFAILLIISSILYFSLESNLHRNEKQFLSSEAKLLNKINGQPKKSLIHYLHHEKAETLEYYWQTLLVTSSIGILFSAFFGFILAYRSMQPLTDISEAMKKTRMEQITDRLTPEKNWPPEFIDVANHFNEMLDRLEASFKRLQQFTGDLAHEFRTPINNLKGEAEICLMKERSISDYQQVIVSSMEEYERLSHMIESLLFLARAEVPQKQLTYKKVYVRKNILAILEFYTPMAEEKSITLHCVGDEEAKIVIQVDELLFQRVLHNLCSNALRYTPPGGSVTIKIHAKNQKVVLQVIDTGMGIAKEHLAHLFTRFYRTDSARHHDSGGSGLGLAIVKSIIDLHHASINIESEVGKGTTVTLVF